MNIESSLGNGHEKKSIFQERLNQYKDWVAELANISPDKKIEVTYLGRKSNELIGDMGKTVHPLEEMQQTMTAQEFKEQLDVEITRLEEFVTEEKVSGETIEEDTDPYSGGAEEPYQGWELVK